MHSRRPLPVARFSFLALLSAAAFASAIAGGGDAPHIQVTPSSLSFEIAYGDSAQQPLTVANSGSGVLNFQVNVVYDSVAALAAGSRLPVVAARLASNRASAPAGVRTDRPLRNAPRTAPARTTATPGATTLLIQDAAPWGTNTNEYLLQVNGIAFDVIPSSGLSSVDLRRYRHVIVPSVQPNAYYLALANHAAEIETFVREGGVLEYHAATYQDEAALVTLPGGMSTYFRPDSVNYVIDPTHPLVAGVPSPFYGSSASHGAFSNIPAGAARIVQDSEGTPNLVEYQLGSGDVIVSCQPLEVGFEIGWPLGAILANMIPYAETRSRTWLSVEPGDGSVATGGNAVLAVHARPGSLVGGDYFATLQVLSNDPLTPQFDVPVHLHVVGIPDITLSSSSIDFGTVFVGGVAHDTLVVGNSGTDKLHVSSIVSSDPQVSVQPSSFDVLPLDATRVIVDYSPTAPGPLSGTLTVTSDDPDEGTLIVTFGGTAAEPPVIAVTPDSLVASLLTGEQSHSTLTIDNSAGASPLEYQITIENSSSPNVRAPKARASVSPLAGARATDKAMQLSAPARTPPSARTRAVPSGSLMFRDGFEDGTFSAWTNTGGSSVDVTNSTAARGTYSLHQVSGPGDDHLRGVFHYFGDVQARFMSFYVRPGSTGRNQCYFVVTDSTGAPVIFFFATDHGTLFSNFDESLPYSLNTWYHVEFRNIDFTTGTFDYYVDGALVQAGLPLLNAGSATNTARVDLYNYSGNSEAWWDEIVVADQPIGSWLTLTPATGTVPAGATAAVDVAFDATGLDGGEYRADVVVNSNDPIRPRVTVPAHLHVTGAPDIALSDVALAFGQVFVGTAVRETLTVRNDGTALLDVSSIVSSDPQFSVAPASFTVPPHQSVPVEVTLTAAAPGAISATLTVTSDDADEGSLVVSLSADAVPPPVIAVTPDSLFADLFTGQQSNQTLTIDNTQGGSPLTFEIQILPTNPLAKSGASSARLAPPANPAAWGPPPGRGAQKIAPLARAPLRVDGTFLPLVLTDPVEGGEVDLTSVRGLSHGGVLEVELGFSSPVVPNNFGGALSLDVDQNPATGSFPSYGLPSQDVGTEFEVYFFGLGSGFLDVYSTVPFFTYLGSVPATVSNNSIRFTLPLALLGGDDGRMNFSGVLGTGFGPTDWFPDAGHGTIGGVNWLAIDPSSGSVPAGQSTGLAANFDAAGLDGGHYYADAIVTSNDPVRSVVHVPVHLRVTGAPHIDLSDSAFAFGQVYVGTTYPETLLVVNDGTDLLTVSSILSSDPQLIVSPTAFTLPAHDSLRVDLALTATGVGPFTATLTISSDAPGQGSIALPVTADAVLPPVIEVTPDSLVADLFTGHQSNQTLTIGNTAGGSPLTFEIQILPSNPLAKSGTARPAPAANSAPWGPPPGGLARRVALAQTLGPPRVDGTPLPLLLTDPIDGGPVDLTTVRGSNHNGVVEFELGFSTSILPFNFGGVLSLDTDQNPATGTFPGYGLPGQDVGTEFEVYLFNLPSGYVDVYQTSPFFTYRGSFPVTVSEHAIRFAIALSTLDGDDGRINFSGAVGTSSGPSDWFPNSGHGTIGGVPWLAIDPLSGSVAAGQSAGLAARFDASGLDGGNYFADAMVTSNDPVRSVVHVPVHLHVTGAPHVVLSDSAIEFGQVFVGSTYRDSLQIVNDGTDVLVVASIVSSDPQVVVDPTAFSLPPRDSLRVAVTLTATGVGPIAASFTIASNAPGQTSIVVPVTADAVLPPVIAVTPDSLVADLFTGQQSNQTLTIGNTAGGSPLTFEIQLQPTNPLAKSGPSRQAPAALAAWGPPPGSVAKRIAPPAKTGTAVRVDGTPLPLLLTDPNDGGPVDLATVRGSNHDGVLEFELGFSTTVDPFNFSGVLSLDADQNPATGTFPTGGFASQDVGTEFEVYLYYARYGYLEVYRTYPFFQYMGSVSATVSSQAVRFAVPLSILDGDDGRMNFSGVVGNNGGPTDWFPDAGHGTIGGVNWLAIDPSSGSVPAGQSTGLAANFDAAGLDGGHYYADAIVTSNDPVRSVVHVPVHLRVTGAPHIDLSDSAFAFGQVYVGTTYPETLLVVNDGTDLLTVSSILSSDPQLIVSPTAFTLPAHDSLRVDLALTATGVGPFTATLTISSDAPGQGSIALPVTADAVLPPVIEVTPGSLSADLLTGEQTTSTLTIDNTAGGSPLQYDIVITDAPPGQPPTRATRAAHAVSPRASVRLGGRQAVSTSGTPALAATSGTHALTAAETAGNPALAARSPSSRTNLGQFADGFEDGTTNAWVDVSAGYTSIDVTAATAAAGTHYSVHMVSQIYNHFDGLFRYFGPGQPRYAGFYVRPGSTNQNQCYFVLRTPIGYEAIWFFATSGGTFYVNEATGGDVAYQSDRWYHIEFRNIDYASKAFDYYVDGALVRDHVPFRNATAVDSLAYVDIYNYDAGANGWWDEVRISNESPAAWLTADPTSGSVPAGSHADVAIHWNAASLDGGDYYAHVNVHSNDPVRPVVEVPAHLHVTGAPDIDLSSTTLDFGSVFVGSPYLDTLTVRNLGSEVLTVNSIATPDPQFAVSPDHFSVPPHQEARVVVTLTPSAPGTIASTLTVTSNDADEGSLAVSLAAQAVLPPVIHVTPDSLVADLLSGQQSDQALTIDNSAGGSPLTFDIQIVSTVALAKSGDVPARRAPAANAVWGPPPGATQSASLKTIATSPRVDGTPLPVLLVDPMEGGQTDLTSVRGSNHDGVLEFELGFSTSVNPNNFGGVLSLDADQNPATGTFPSSGLPSQDVGTEFELYFFGLPSVYVYRTVPFFNFVGSFPATVSEHAIRFAITLSTLDGDDGRMNFSGVVGTSSVMTDWFPDAGHGTIGGVPWLTVTPLSGSVPAGQSMNLAARFDASDLPGGDYRAIVQVTSNDPVTPNAIVPAHLHVTGAPDIDLSASELDFGTVVAGTTVHRSLAVTNRGSDPLDVSAISVNDPQFVATPTHFVLAPEESAAVDVAFTPTAPGSPAATLTLTSNDPDEGSAFVALRALAAAGPRFVETPDHVTETVPHGTSLAVNLGIRNSGDLPLTWTLQAQTFGPTRVVASMEPAVSRGTTPASKAGPDPHPIRAASEPMRVMAADSQPQRVAPRAARAASGSRAAVTSLASGADPSLETVLAALDTGYTSVTNLIPNRYDFTDGETGYYIADGGFDMYDYGNYIGSQLGESINYSNGVIASSAIFGPNARYFTRKYPGLFVCVADLDNVPSFTVWGNLGADGFGSVDGVIISTVVNGVSFTGFVKRVFGAFDPSVNHLIILQDRPGLAHEFAFNTDYDDHKITGLAGGTRIYDLVFSATDGGYIDNAAMTTIMNQFLSLLGPTWLSANPHGGTLEPGGSQLVEVTIDAHELAPGEYAGDLIFQCNDLMNPVTHVPVAVTVEDVTATTLALVEARAEAGVARLTWSSGDASGRATIVQRREAGASWSQVATVTADGEGYVRFVDSGVTSGHTYGYRAGYAGSSEFTSEVLVEIPAAEFALHGPMPNPADPSLRVAFTLPDMTPATLELIDLAGRRLVVRDVGGLGPGRHVVALGEGRPMPAGMYLVRINRAGRSLTSKVAVVE